MDSILRLLMGPLTTYIIRVLSDQGPQRFGALKRAVPGISTRMLTERLRMLQSAGVISREQAETIPPAVTDGLSPRGGDLRSVLGALGNIAERWKDGGVFDAEGMAMQGPTKSD
jgi:DNA-binding HxlR family transcriptional regulator